MTEIPKTDHYINKKLWLLMVFYFGACRNGGKKLLEECKGEVAFPCAFSCSF